MPIKVFYDPRQSCESANSYSPSAAKPAKVVADWLSDERIAPHIQIETFNKATDDVLCEAHDPAYIAGILDGSIDNGFGNNSPEIAESLRYTVGSMLAAAKYVLNKDLFNEERVAVSPTSGFHHAGHSFGGGYCTLNGLVITAKRLKTLGLVNRVLILDLDQHYGNGTQDIIDTLGLDWITHITAGKSYDTARDALSHCWLAKEYAPTGRNPHDLLLYQAGADIHVDDPLGGRMTTQQMQERDKAVFLCASGYGLPCVWNLAGGYKRDAQGTIEPVLALHRQTMLECIKQYPG
jgi:acetoin utilization deacetylase AcuC-like enzyme